MLEHAPLEAVYVYFDTAVYDEIERDIKVIFVSSNIWWAQNKKELKVTMEAQLGLIGGTMGLLTGFSILSGVEIIYYLFRFPWFILDNFLFFRFVLSLKLPRVEDLMSAVKKRFEKDLTEMD